MDATQAQSGGVMAKIDAYSNRTVGKHSSATMGVLIVLVFLVILLLWQRQKHKDDFAVAAMTAAPSATAEARPRPPVPRTACGHAVPGFDLGPFAPCSGNWDPAASAEAMALATSGGLPQENYGEMRLRGAINTAYDTGDGLTDDQLANLMHQGGTP